MLGYGYGYLWCYPQIWQRRKGNQSKGYAEDVSTATQARDWGFGAEGACPPIYKVLGVWCNEHVKSASDGCIVVPVYLSVFENCVPPFNMRCPIYLLQDPTEWSERLQLLWFNHKEFLSNRGAYPFFKGFHAVSSRCILCIWYDDLGRVGRVELRRLCFRYNT